MTREPVILPGVGQKKAAAEFNKGLVIAILIRRGEGIMMKPGDINGLGIVTLTNMHSSQLIGTKIPPETGMSPEKVTGTQTTIAVGGLIMLNTISSLNLHTLPGQGLDLRNCHSLM